MLLASQRGIPDIRFAIVHLCTSENRCREALRPVTLIDPCFRQWRPSLLAVPRGSCVLMFRLQSIVLRLPLMFGNLLLAPSSKRQPGANLVKLLLSRREGTLDRYLQREATQDLEISRTVEAKYNDRGRAQSCVKVAGY